jgi:hypothetical protein
MSARPQFLRGFEQRDGGDVIDTRMHRATPIHQPPLSDDAHDWRQEQAEEDERIERMHTACDRAIFVIFARVLILVLADRYAHLLPGGGL